MSHLYGEILRFAKVVQTEPTAAEQAKLDKFRKLPYQEKTTKNLTTDEETTLTTPRSGADGLQRRILELSRRRD